MENGPSHHGALEEASAGREAGATPYLTGDGFKSGLWPQVWPVTCPDKEGWMCQTCVNKRQTLLHCDPLLSSLI